MHKVLEDMVNSRDFLTLLAKLEELFNIYNLRRDKKANSWLNLFKEVFRQLFKNEI